MRNTAIIFVIALLYAFAARLGFFLAAPDTVVSPVWPPAGIAFAAVLIVDYLKSSTLRYFFSILIFMLSIWMWRFELDAMPTRPLPLWLAQLLAFFVGFFSALLGVSIFAVPFLLKLGLDIRKAIGTATVMALVYCMFTCPWYIFLGLDKVNLPDYSIGYVNFMIVLAATLPGILATYLAVKFAHYLPRSILKRCFVGLMLVVSVVMALPR